MTVVAQDPSLVDKEGRTVLASAAVPTERLDPGPRGHRFHVVDYDTTTQHAEVPAMVASASAEGDGWEYLDPFASGEPVDVVGDRAFHAQNVYAIAARTLALFERHLGRRVPWRFADHQLFLVPHAFVEPNAFYSPDDRAVFFGYVPGERSGETVYTCLSHDVIAHEVTHAILDGLRPRFLEPGPPDQMAFHEGLADVVAMLSVLSIEASGPNETIDRPGVLETLLLEKGPDVVDRDGRIPAALVGEHRLRLSALAGMAEQFGNSISGGRKDSLRRSVDLEAGGWWRDRAEFDEPHRRGEVLVAAVMTAFLTMWTRRLAALIHDDDTIDLARAAEEGRKAAEHLLGMCIRALDYTPPVDLEFEDFLDGVLKADLAVVPDDDHGYRSTITEAFASFAITTADSLVGTSAGGASSPARVATAVRERYPQVNFGAIQVDRDEVYRFIWSNADLLGIDLSYRLRVERVRHSTRVGPDGLVVSETVADYIQTMDTTVARLAGVGIAVAAGGPPNVAGEQGEDAVERWGEVVKPGAPVQLWGGGVLFFDQFGGLRLQVRKPLLDTDRQARRLNHLISHGIMDSDGRYGFSDGEGTLRFALLHQSVIDAGETW